MELAGGASDYGLKPHASALLEHVEGGLAQFVVRHFYDLARHIDTFTPDDPHEPSPVPSFSE